MKPDSFGICVSDIRFMNRCHDAIWRVFAGRLALTFPLTPLQLFFWLSTVQSGAASILRNAFHLPPAARGAAGRRLGKYP